MEDTAIKALRIHPDDTVAVALEALAAGSVAEAGGVRVAIAQDIPKGHKFALVDIDKGQTVLKYGFAIGKAGERIPAGAWVHTHNISTRLSEGQAYQYRPQPANIEPYDCKRTFSGYWRDGGLVGIRNEIWIIPTVGCVNRTAENIAREANRLFAGDGLDGVFAYTHPYGCSQMGDDHLNTQLILSGLVKHPNAAGVLVLGLGCENNLISLFGEVLGPVDEERVKFLVAQEVEDEQAAGVELIGVLAARAKRFQREPIPVSELKIGLKCGGSDGFSGITANPLVGALSDRLTACGGTTILGEVPEMFGAEEMLMDRAASRQVFDAAVDMVNGFKAYYVAHDQPVYENPSPGNKAGGISTLEEKSLGCTQKGGKSPVVDVLPYGGVAQKRGLNLISGPGNDIVACTVLVAAGAHMILFTTGRGNPLGAPVPTLKIATNSELAERKRHWIDFNAGALLEGMAMEQACDELFQDVIAVASGRAARNEENGYREIAIFKNGVTL